MEKETAELIKHVADKIDAPVQQLWDGLVAFAPFTYDQWLFKAAIIVVIFLAFVGLTALAIHYAKKDNDYETGVLFAGFGAVGVLIVFGVEVVGTSAEAFSAKHAPQAWAAQQVLKKISR